MNSPFDRKLEELFERAGSIPEDRRGAFLESVRREDPRLHAELVELLDHLRGADRDSFLAVGPGPLPTEPARGGGPTRADRDAREDLGDRFAPAERPDEIGRLGDYRILRRIGAGSMGVVYAAEELRLGRVVALKVMQPGLADRETNRRRFLREARAAAAVQHDHVVVVFQVGEERGLPYLAMPLLEGETLGDRLDREGRLATPEVLRVGQELADGLAAAHVRGLIHRDIKPGNIWLEAPTGRVKILDFGLARSADASDEGGLTRPGALLGTPHYLAPEQAAGLPLDPRCDLFSLGCVLYRAATGETPFRGENLMALLGAIAMRTPPEPIGAAPGMPRALSDLILRLLAKAPGDRPESAEVVRAELGRIERGLAASAAGPSRPRPAATRMGPARRPRWRRAALVAGVASLLAVTMGYSFGPTALRVATNRGELIVEVDDPDVEISVIRGGVAVVEKASRSRFELTPGDGEVAVYEKSSGLKLATRAFTLTRGGRETVRVVARPGVTAPGAPPTAPSIAQPTAPPPADLPNPFRISAADGQPRGEYPSLVEALSVVRDGDVVEVFGRGPFRFNPTKGIALEQKSVILRAAPGYRPRIDNTQPLRAHHPILDWDQLFSSAGGRLQIEGCDFSISSHFYRGAAGARLELDRCRVAGAPALAFLQDAGVELTDTMIAINPAGHGADPVVGIGSKAWLKMKNSIFFTTGNVFSFNNTTVEARLTILDSTIVGYGLLKFHNEPRVGRSAFVDVRNTILAIPDLPPAPPGEEDARDKVVWEGGDNLFEVSSALLPASRAVVPASVEILEKSGWGRFVREADPGSRATGRVIWGWNAGYYLPQEAVVAALRPKVEAWRARGGALADLGPDWDSLGPGEPYARDRRRSRPDEPVRPPAPDAGPFVLLRGGHVVEGFAKLEAAVAQAQDGDEIEVRGDGPYPGYANFAGVRRKLTCRAAPGYRPVLEGRVSLSGSDRLTFEGLTFRRPEFHLKGGATLERMAFCAFEDRSINGIIFHRYSAQNRFRAAGRDGHPTEIVSCILPHGFQMNFDLGDGLTIRNSALGRLRLVVAEQARGRLSIDRSTVTALEWSCLEFNHGDLKAPNGRFEVASSRTLFESSQQLVAWSTLYENEDRESRFAPLVSRFSGEANVYRLGALPLFSTRSRNEATAGLDALRGRWDGLEVGSAMGEPAIDDPDSWRLLPGTPASHPRPDGRDYGADLTRALLPR